MDKLAEISHGAKVVLGATIAFLIISFLNWQEVDLGGFGSAGVSMWHGVGVIAGLLAIAIIAWQAIRLANLKVELGVGPAMITAFLAVLLFVFTLIKFLADSEFRTFWAWLGLILSIIIVGGAWANMKMTGESVGDLKAKMDSMTGGGGAAAAGGGGAAAAGTEAPSAPAEAPSAPAADAASDAASDAPDSKA